MDIPIAPANQMLAAVVRFFTLAPSFSISPAPKKPMPETIWAAILESEAGSTVADINVKSIEPAITSIWVLMPASLPRSSRSKPIAKPTTKLRARSIRNLISFGPKKAFQFIN